MISLDLMKSSEVRIPGDQPKRVKIWICYSSHFDRNDVLKKFLVLGKWARLV